MISDAIWQAKHFTFLNFFLGFLPFLHKSSSDWSFIDLFLSDDWFVLIDWREVLLLYPIKCSVPNTWCAEDTLVFAHRLIVRGSLLLASCRHWRWADKLAPPQTCVVRRAEVYLIVLSTHASLYLVVVKRSWLCVGPTGEQMVSCSWNLQRVLLVAGWDQCHEKKRCDKTLHGSKGIFEAFLLDGTDTRYCGQRQESATQPLWAKEQIREILLGNGTSKMYQWVVKVQLQLTIDSHSAARN